MRSHLSFGIAAVALAATLGSAPASAGAATRPGSRAEQAAATFQHLSGQRLAKHQKPLLYAASFTTSTIFVFDQSEKSPASPKYTITSGLEYPNGITTDTAGNLYVTNEGSNALTIYAPGGSTPAVTITTGMNVPFDVAVDSGGNIFVANDPSGQSPYINEYLAGQTSPAYTWYPPQSSSTITGLALLSPNSPGESTIYATYYTYDQYGNAHGDVIDCYPGNSACFDVGYSFGRTAGVAVEESPFQPSAPFDFLVADQSAPGIYNILNNTQITLFSTPDVPWYMAFNASRTDLFVTSGGSSVTQYAYPSMKKRRMYVGSGGFEGPEITGVAVTPAGTYF